ncbi:hypothetical protein GQ53DRAFT_888985 [Thozetella sp. PMI_491]|nr:hypothetical protein GQ53DRAFT_888985 [Thozetella sp. PMI_491]
MGKSPSMTLDGSAESHRGMDVRAGFSTWYNFILWLIFAGILLAFSIVRLDFLRQGGSFCISDSGGATKMSPGECFYFSQTFYRNAMVLHLAGILPAAILVPLQFLPVVRCKALLIHKVAGYVSVVFSVVGTIGGFMVIPPAFGGGVDVHTSTGVLGVVFLGALIMAMANMLRAWVVSSSIVTARVLLVILAIVISASDVQYSAEPCDKIAWVLGNDQDLTVLSYPECEAYFSGLNPYQHASIKADFLSGTPTGVMAALDVSFGAIMWLCIFLHVFGVEFYVSGLLVTSKWQPSPTST